MIALASRFEDDLADLVVGRGATKTDLSGQHRRVAGRLAPRKVADVVRIVQAAGRYGVKLHPLSCGRNWGFGSALPAEAGAWVIDLGNLKRCHSYQGETGSICIEPGVTQIDLYEALSSLGGDWFFNVTGAGHTTSILGNALERGIGYYGQRHLDLIELQVVTGAGEIINTRLGLASEPFGLASVGTDITQLFTQGHFGIVVSARIRLIKRTDGGGAAIVRLKEAGRIREFFQEIIALKQDGCIQGVPHIANRDRIITTMAPWLEPDQVSLFSQRAAPWTAALPVTGCREMTETAFGCIRRRLGSFCEIETIFSSKNKIDHSAVASPLEQLQQLASGYPSNLAIPGVEWSGLGKADRAIRDPESTEAGLIHVTPALASSVAEMERALETVQAAAREFGLESLPITVNLADLQTTVLVISISFARQDAKSAQAKAKKLQRRLSREGFRPYRIGLGQESWLGLAAPAASSIFRQLKTAFDPLGIFVASKYDAPHAGKPSAKAARRTQMAMTEVVR